MRREMILAGTALALSCILLPSQYARAQAVAVAAASSDWVQVPGGLQIHKSCIHSVPNGGRVGADGSVWDGNQNLVEAFRDCLYPRRTQTNPPGVVNGWVEDAEVYLPASFFDKITGDWYVPSLPSVATGQTIYLFNSLQYFSIYQPLDTIIQPVLEYFGGSNGWQMQDWIVQGNSAYTGAAVSVNEGDHISGLIQLNTSTQYQIQWTDITSGNWWWIHLDLTGSFANQSYQVANPGVLEVYNVTACNQLPNTSGTEFFYVGMYEGSPSWNSFTTVDPYGSSWTLQITPGLNPSCAYTVYAPTYSNWVYLEWRP